MKNKHNCSGEFEIKENGPAFDICLEDSIGRFWVTNYEYANQVNFCPYCGEKAPTPGLEEDQIDHSWAFGQERWLRYVERED